MSSRLRIAGARSPAAVNEFIDFAYRLRGRESRWVPPLRRDMQLLLDRLRHPFHDHADVEYFLARRDGETSGRVAVIENHAHNAHHKERIGFFGFLDAVNEPAVFHALMGKCEAWARGRGLTSLRGPCNFSTNEECGLLVDNFDADPMLMTPYHPPYYRERIEELGYTKAEDLIAWWNDAIQFTERVPKLAAAIEVRLERQAQKFTFRKLRLKELASEVRIIRRIYNAAWADNWGFVPITEAEIDLMARELRPIVDPGMVWFAEADGEPVAFGLGMPDYNVVLKHLNGRLGWREIALALLLRRRIKAMRMMMLGVLPEYRRMGLDLLLIQRVIDYCFSKGVFQGELSWILERNRAMNRVIEATGARIYKRYRLYEKPLETPG